MIGQIRGRLADKRPNQLLVDVGGVGYQVQVPLSTFAALGELHTEVTLLIHTHVREDALALYGFLSSREKHFFELLLSASGVGPALALKILSGMSVEELVPAIRGGDLARLTRIPGVGRKTAERIGGGGGPLDPAAELVPVLVVEDEDRDGPIAVVQEAVRQVEILVAEEHAE